MRPKLHSKTSDELLEMYKEYKAKRKEVRLKKAAQHDTWNFGHPRHEPDFEVWNKRLVWSVREAICLSLGKDPVTTSFKSGPFPPSILRDDYELRKQALTSMEQLDLDDKRPVGFFVSWFCEKALSTPEEFGHSKLLEPTEAETLILKLQAEIASLRAEIKKAEPKINRTKIYACSDILPGCWKVWI